MQPLDEASAAIEQQLVSARQQAQQTEVQNDFIEKWKARTQCIDEVMMQFCDGFVPPEAETVPGQPPAAEPAPVNPNSPIEPGTATPSIDGTRRSAPPRARRSPSTRPRQPPAPCPRARFRSAPTAPPSPPDPTDDPVSADPAEPSARDVEAAARSAAAVGRLDEITRLLRRECPWDREQDERSIVPHTVEEAYELADAAASGDDEKLATSSATSSSRSTSSACCSRSGGRAMGEVAGQMTEKLVRRHPHVFGEAEVDGAGEVLSNWDRIKREKEGREGLFADVPENLPALLTRASSSGGPRTGRPRGRARRRRGRGPGRDDRRDRAAAR